MSKPVPIDKFKEIIVEYLEISKFWIYNNNINFKIILKKLIMNNLIFFLEF